MLEKKQDIEKELKMLILRGTCPHCDSENIKYREYITNLTFGFECFNCGWKSQYHFTELKKASVNWFSRES